MNLQQKVIKNKLGLISLADELGNISQACKILGYSRDSFYRYRALVNEGGADGLLEKNRRKPNPANRICQTFESAILHLTLQYPTHGRERIADMLRLDGIVVSSSAVYNVWRRSDLSTPQLRLKWLEKKVAEEGLILTEEQKLALEKKKDDQQGHGQIETQHPGYLGSQDTFYVGTLKGVGRIYQQTFVDTYSKVAACKLYTMKTALTAADMLNDRVLPFFESKGIPMLRILTDRGSEFCGAIETHPYQLFLSVSEIDHTRTKAYHPQTNGICERFHRTILDEFYRITFRVKIYETLEDLQSDLDQWVDDYNTKRTHQGRHCFGRTPMETLTEDWRKWQTELSERGLQTVN